MRRCLAVAGVALLAGCVSAPSAQVEEREFYGTLEPFASEAVYFLLTDRFVDGDSSNNHVEQGGPDPDRRTFDRPLQVPGYAEANIGYLGGDFKGVLDNAAYIADMGFTAIWTTPIVDNPDEAFTGSKVPGRGPGGDRGKTGFHGYWGVNFFAVDEHLESDGLAFADFTRRLRDEHDLKYVLDVVCNHGSPAYTMPSKQPQYGQLFDANGDLIADHKNMHPAELDPTDPLQAFFNRAPGLGELSDFDENNPDVMDYFVAAYSQWLDQGAAAFRIDTIAHMPHSFWKRFSDRIRDKQPGLFMFSEHFAYDAEAIAPNTWPENGSISVLDFPGKEAMNKVFADGAAYSELEDYLHLDSGLYENPYDLMTFYDNHDMDRMAADTNGFIDANNWLFTSRGIPVVYYGSESGFQAGTNEHTGNRNYFGQENVDAAVSHPISKALTRIANIRKNSIALQRGLQIDTEFGPRSASFFRVYQNGDVRQTALVLLNGGDEPVTMEFGQLPANGVWKDAVTGHAIKVDRNVTGLRAEIAPHGVRVYLSDAPLTQPEFVATLEKAQAAKNRRKSP